MLVRDNIILVFYADRVEEWMDEMATSAITRF